MSSKNTVLLSSIQKAGSTWVRFVIANYYNILNHHATDTLTFKELEEPHILRVEKGIHYKYKDGYPLVFHTHLTYDGYGIFDYDPKMSEYFDSFDKIIYLYRNPFDTIISYWHFMMERTTPEPFGDGVKGLALEKLKTLEGFVGFYLPRWIRHVKTTMPKASLIMDYDDTWKQPYKHFYRMFELIDTDIDTVILRKAIQMSSFTNVRKMSEDVNQRGGLGMPYYTGYFCRVGTPEQYKIVMSSDLIQRIRTECKKENITV